MPFNRSILGLDWGLDHPSAVVWVKVDTGNKMIYIPDEFVKAGLGIDDVCEAIRFKCEGNVPEYGVIDPSAARRDPTTKRSIVDEYRRCFRGLGNAWDYFSIKLGDNKDRGYEITKRYFKKGMIKIHPRCKNLIYALENLMVGEDKGDDLCLVAGTKVDCIDGLKNIEDVRENDFVLTRGGYCRVLKSAMTNHSAEVYRLQVSDGRTLTGTGNHPVFLGDGSTKGLSELKKEDILVDRRCLNLIQSDTWKSKSAREPAKNLTDSNTTFAEIISSAISGMGMDIARSTGTFGDSITAKSQRASRSTTKTTTDLTTKYQISRPFTGQSIWLIICPTRSGSRKQESLWKMLASSLFCGTNQMPQSRSTENMEKFYGKTKNGLKNPARSVLVPTKRRSLNGQSIVTKTADKQLRKPVTVSSVTRLNTKQSVYNLSVEGHNEFFANGLLVHNCDALRYACVNIHDSFQGMNELIQGEPVYTPQVNADGVRVFNFNDPYMFPEKGTESDDPILDMIYATH